MVDWQLGGGGIVNTIVPQVSGFSERNHSLLEVLSTWKSAKSRSAKAGSSHGLKSGRYS